jgi:predicted nucleic acid-binding protein
MHAVDTNVVVRYLIGDHPAQSAKARALIDGQDVFVGTTVMLETERVLRSVYGLSAAKLCQGLRAFAGLARVSVENPARLSEALDLAERAWISPTRCISARRHIVRR